MANNKVDLSNIKEQINKRKAAAGVLPEQKKQARDAFLTELLQARNTGTPTKASEKVKIVERVSDRVGADGRVSSGNSSRNVDPNLLAHVNTPTNNPTIPQHYPSQQQYQPVNEGMLPERDSRYDAQVNQLYDQYRGGNQPQTQQPNSFGMLTEQQVAQIMAQQGQGGQLPQNQILTEQVGTAINGFINDNMGVIVEQAMKNAVMEMYSIERIKKTLDENRDLIQKIVIDTIKMLSERKKANTTK